MDPKELVMQIVQVLGPEVVIGMLTDPNLLNMVVQFAQAVGQLQDGEKQQLAQVVQQMAQQGAGNAEQQAQGQPSSGAFGGGAEQNPFA
jgi:hypothetical protein